MVSKPFLSGRRGSPPRMSTTRVIPRVHEPTSSSTEQRSSTIVVSRTTFHEPEAVNYVGSAFGIGLVGSTRQRWLIVMATLHVRCSFNGLVRDNGGLVDIRNIARDAGLAGRCCTRCVVFCCCCVLMSGCQTSAFGVRFEDLTPIGVVVVMVTLRVRSIM